MTAKIEQNCPGITFFLATYSLDQRAFDCMVSLRCRENAFCLCKCHTSIESFSLRVGCRLYLVQIHELTDQRCHAVIAQATRMRARRDER